MELKDQLKDLFQAQNQEPRFASWHDTYGIFQSWVIGAKTTLDHHHWEPNKCIGGHLEPFTKEDWDKLVQDIENPYYIQQSILILHQMSGLANPKLLKIKSPTEYREAWLMMLNGNTSWLNTLQVWYFG